MANRRYVPKCKQCNSKDVSKGRTICWYCIAIAYARSPGGYYKPWYKITK